MDVFWSVVGLIVILILCMFLRASVEKVERKRGVRATSLGKHVRGIPGVADGETVTIHLYDDRITFNDRQTISLERILQAAIVPRTRLDNDTMPKKLHPKPTDKFLVIDYVNVRGAEAKAVVWMLTSSSSIAARLIERTGCEPSKPQAGRSKPISFPHEV